MSETPQVRKLRTRLVAIARVFVGELAHAIRNPLNSATLQLSVLERRIADPGPIAPLATANTIRDIRSELQRLDGIVEAFVAFSESGHLEDWPAGLPFLDALEDSTNGEKP